MSVSRVWQACFPLVAITLGNDHYRVNGGNNKTTAHPVVPMSAGPTTDTAPLEHYLDDALGDRVPIRVTALTGGGSCEVFALDRGPARWVLRRAPRHASSATGRWRYGTLPVGRRREC